MKLLITTLTIVFTMFLTSCYKYVNKDTVDVIYAKTLGSGHSCGETRTDDFLLRCQYTTVKNVGNGRYFIEGFTNLDAIEGAETFCKERKDKSNINIKDLMPSRNSSSTLIFSCEE